MNEGIIYVMTTTVSGLIKIGITSEKQYPERMRFLRQNGYHNISGLKEAFAIMVSDYKEKEKLLQKVFSAYRVDESELFSLDVDIVIELLMAFEGKVIYPEIKDKEKEFNVVAKTNEQNSLFTFQSKGLKVGDIITFTKDKSITAKVVGKREVEYNGNKWKLSPLVRKLFEDRGEVNKSGAYQGAAYFEYNGKKLKDLPDIC